MSRARRDIDPELIERMLERGADVKMICATLRMSRQTFYTRVKQDPRLAEALKYGRDKGDYKLHLAQFKSATKHGNVKMQQWLGIQRLKQSYRPDLVKQDNQLETDVFNALGVDPQLLSDEDIETLLCIVEKGRPKEEIKDDGIQSTNDQ